MDAVCWQEIILPLQSKTGYDDPISDVVITAVFSGPSGEEIRREAYWDGGTSYCISFAPTRAGAWHYCIIAPEETGLNGLEGDLNCVPYTGPLAIYRHGFLKTVPGCSYLMHDDGTPFFWLGDTHWDFAIRERWDQSNYPGMDSMFRGIADLRAAQGFTVYQTNLRCGEYASLFWTDKGGLNLAFFQNELDRRMHYIAGLGMVDALGLGWYGAVGAAGEGLDAVKRLARYVIARYGALPVVWTLAGDTGGSLPGKPREENLRLWREVALYIEKLDGYGTLQTAHPCSVLPYADFYEGESWFDFTLNQAGHGNLPLHFLNYRDWFAAHPHKPFVEGEAMYELCSTLETNGPRLCTDELVRRAAYTAIQCGCCGYSYGAQGIWDSVWDEADRRPWADLFNRFGITWTQALEAPGGKQMGYLCRFYKQQQFHLLTPDLDPERDAGFGTQSQLLVLADSSRSHFVIYYPNSLCAPCCLTGMKPGSYTLQWFDPRTGLYGENVTFTPENGTWTTPPPKDRNDWLLVVRLLSETALPLP